MNFVKTFLSPSFFGLAALCFLLPFLEIKCTDKVLVKATGVELMTGKQFSLASSTKEMLGETSIPSDSKDNRDIAPQPMLILTFLLSIAGIVISFVGFRQKNLTSTILGFLGFLLLLIFKFTFENGMAKSMAKSEDGGSTDMNKSMDMMKEMIKVEFAPAFYLTILFLLAAGVLGLYLKSNEVAPDENADLRQSLEKETDTILDTPTATEENNA